MTDNTATVKQVTEQHGMFLSELRIKDFRSCRDTSVKLQKELTLVVGENNSGKSNVVDAIRLCTEPLNGRRSRYFSLDDYSDYGTSELVEVTTTYNDLTQKQIGRFLTALDQEKKTAHYTVRYVPDPNISPRRRVSFLSGPQPAADPEPENRTRINHVYLPPLRNAQEALDSAQGGRLVEIVRSLTSKEEQEDFVTATNSKLSSIVDHDVVKKSTESITGHINRLTDPVRGQSVALSFEALKLHRLIRNLRIKMAEKGVDPADLAQSGLGYANLLYIATVILELQAAPESELTIFLVEEPEAHLHPQLQGVLLDYLFDHARKSVQDDAHSAAGRIQVVATTHSPNLASKVGSRNVVVLKRAFGTDGEHISETRALALNDIPLSADERRKVDQYLDVTRSELLFGREVILVEGIAEAVLLPPLAKRALADIDDDGFSLRRFRAASIINVGSVDFAPYIKLMAQAIDGVRLTDKMIVITDGDPEPEADDDPDNEPDTIYNRKADLEAVAATISAQDIVHVYASDFTLEADLMEPVTSNKGSMKAAFLDQKPRSEVKFDRWCEAESPARALYEHLRAHKKYLAKGEFAHALSIKLETDESFTCPDYLRIAIRDVAGLGSEDDVH